MKIFVLLMTTGILSLPADASENINATIDLKDSRRLIKIIREDDHGREKNVVLKNTRVGIRFSDPMNKNIERVLFDPLYFPPQDPSKIDFFVTTAIEDPDSGEIWEAGSGLCNWSKGAKKVAICGVEDDGGRYRVVLYKPGTGSSDGILKFEIANIDGYKGFRVGNSKDYQSSLTIKLKSEKGLVLPVNFGSESGVNFEASAKDNYQTNSPMSYGSSPWNCRNKDLEITCSSNKCEASDSFTPVSININKNGALSICAYSGCWEGKGKVMTSGKHILVSGRKLKWSGTTPNNADFIVALDASDKVGFIKGEGFAMPINCSQD